MVPTISLWALANGQHMLTLRAYDTMTSNPLTLASVDIWFYPHGEISDLSLDKLKHPSVQTILKSCARLG